MSLKLTVDEVKLMTMLYNNRQLERVRALFERELEETTKALIKAGPDFVQRVQGRAQLLNELLEAFDKRSINQER